MTSKPKVEISIADFETHQKMMDTCDLAKELIESRHDRPEEILNVLTVLHKSYTQSLISAGYHIDYIPTKQEGVIAIRITRNIKK